MSLQQVIQDFEKRYNRTWVWVRFSEGSPEHICYIDNVVYDNDLDDGLIFLNNSKFGQLQIKYKQAGAEMDFRWPPTGYFQCDEVPIYAHRGHDRQWKRGVCKGNFSLQNIFRNVLSSSVVSNPGLGEKTLTAIESFKPVSLPDALTRLNKKYLGQALTKDFAVTLSHINGYHHILWFRNALVAGLVDHNIHLLQDIWRQEVLDYTRVCGGEFWLR